MYFLYVYFSNQTSSALQPSHRRPIYNQSHRSHSPKPQRRSFPTAMAEAATRERTGFQKLLLEMR